MTGSYLFDRNCENHKFDSTIKLNASETNHGFLGLTKWNENSQEGTI